MRGLIHNALFVVAVGMFILGVLVGAGWLINCVFGDRILSEFQSDTMNRILQVFFCGSAGIFHMLAYWNYREKRRDRRLRG